MNSFQNSRIVLRWSVLTLLPVVFGCSVSDKLAVPAHEANYVLVSDPVAAIKAVLPKGWAVIEVRKHAYPFYRPPGDGMEIVIGDPAKPHNEKPTSRSRVYLYIMPPNYNDGDDSPTRETDMERNQTYPPQLVAVAKDAKLYAWGVSSGKTPSEGLAVANIREALLVHPEHSRIRPSKP